MFAIIDHRGRTISRHRTLGDALARARRLIDWTGAAPGWPSWPPEQDVPLDIRVAE